MSTAGIESDPVPSTDQPTTEAARALTTSSWTWLGTVIRKLSSAVQRHFAHRHLIFVSHPRRHGVATEVAVDLQRELKLLFGDETVYFDEDKHDIGGSAFEIEQRINRAAVVVFALPQGWLDDPRRTAPMPEGPATLPMSGRDWFRREVAATRTAGLPDYVGALLGPELFSTRRFPRAIPIAITEEAAGREEARTTPEATDLAGLPTEYVWLLEQLGEFGSSYSLHHRTKVKIYARIRDQLDRFKARRRRANVVFTAVTLLLVGFLSVRVVVAGLRGPDADNTWYQRMSQQLGALLITAAGATPTGEGGTVAGPQGAPGLQGRPGPPRPPRPQGEPGGGEAPGPWAGPPWTPPSSTPPATPVEVTVTVPGLDDGFASLTLELGGLQEQFGHLLPDLEGAKADVGILKDQLSELANTQSEHSKAIADGVQERTKLQDEVKDTNPTVAWRNWNARQVQTRCGTGDKPICRKRWSFALDGFQDTGIRCLDRPERDLVLYLDGRAPDSPPAVGFPDRAVSLFWNLRCTDATRGASTTGN